MNIEEIAKACHTANKAYCKSIGDKSQKSWGRAPDWQRQSAMTGVEFVLAQLNAGQEPSPSASHESWLKEKLADGWGFGEKKDEKKKTHPCCVDYDDLPDEQKKKDEIFIDVVKSFFTPIEKPATKKPAMLGDDVKVTPIKATLAARQKIKDDAKKSGQPIPAAKGFKVGDK